MNTKETKLSTTQIGRTDDWLVYRHIRLDLNVPFYIGIAKNTNRPSNKRYRSNLWKYVANKTSYDIEILLDHLTKEQAIEKEIEFINLYGRVDLKTGTLCNMTSGGEGTGSLNPELESERREKISKALIGNSLDAETKLKITIGQKNRIPVTIEGVEYPSLRQAGLALGMHKATVKSRYL